MSLWPHGVVTNCFKSLLDRGESLAEICRRCELIGLGYIELRQYSLDCDPRSLSEGDLRLHFEKIRDAVTAIEFDYAIDIPFLSGTLVEAQDDIRDAMAIAESVAGSHRPHIRIVDTTTRGEHAAKRISESVASLVALGQELNSHGIALSVEHAKQPWHVFWEVFVEARQRCGNDYLKLCFDPANFALALEMPKLLEVESRLPIEVVSMFHVKQSDGPRITTSLGGGDIDWNGQYEFLFQAGYERALMFEMTTSDEIWNELEAAMATWRSYMS